MDAPTAILLAIVLLAITFIGLALVPWYLEDRRKRKALEAAKKGAARPAPPPPWKPPPLASFKGVPVRRSSVTPRGTILVEKKAGVVTGITMHPEDGDVLLPALLSPTWAPESPPPPPKWEGEGGSFAGAGASGSWDAKPEPEKTESFPVVSGDSYTRADPAPSTDGGGWHDAGASAAPDTSSVSDSSSSTTTSDPASTGGDTW